MPTYCECETCQEVKRKITKEVNDVPENCDWYLELDGGKYAIYQKIGEDGSYEFKALRYGEPWQDLCGNNLVYNLMVELILAKNRLQKIKKIMEGHCYADADNNVAEIKSILGV